MKHLIALSLAVLAAAVAAQETPLRLAAFIEASEQRKLGAAHFEIDLDSNTLIVTTDHETNETIKLLVAELDRPIPQVLINVLFLEVTYTDDLDWGTEFAYTASSGGGGTRALASVFGLGGLAQGGALSLTRGELDVVLKALSTKTRTEVLSRPSIMTRNNQESTITIGSQVPFIRNSQVTDSGNVLNTIEYEDVGIILRVTPRINADGVVEMDVAPEISAIAAETVQISDSVAAPTFAKRSAETRVVVPSGRTVVIGGLMEDQETSEVRKVPLLGDIPAVGGLFRRTIRSKTKTELLIFLTPEVVTGSTADSLVEKEKRAVGIANSVDADKLRRYFDSVGGTDSPAPARSDP